MAKSKDDKNVNLVILGHLHMARLANMSESMHPLPIYVHEEEFKHGYRALRTKMTYPITRT